MIASIRGTVLSVAGTIVIVEVGGIGMAVQITPQHGLNLRLGHEALLHTTLIVREDDLSLFGFATTDELQVFDLLRGVSGVGPKSALGVLATLTPSQIAQAVADEDDAPFRKVSGIGPKTAKLIAVSLAGKLVAPASPSGAASIAPNSVSANVVSALIGLGWNPSVAAQAVDDAVSSADDTERGSVQALLRMSLAALGPAGRS